MPRREPNSHQTRSHQADSLQDGDALGDDLLELAGGLAHEIKNPLSTIRLNMELLAEDIAESQDPAVRRSLKRVEIVQRECQRLQELLDNFLSFAKVQVAELEAANLNDELGSALDFFAPEAAQANVELQRYFDADLPHVLLDKERFRAALLNLLLNAKQAMPDGGQLMVRTTRRGPNVAILLIDSGCGMDEHTASRMFDAFFSTKRGGSGLGLPTAGKIIAAHGGRISVESEIGQGTQFLIELPVPQRIDSGAAAQAGPGR